MGLNMSNLSVSDLGNAIRDSATSLCNRIAGPATEIAKTMINGTTTIVNALEKALPIITAVRPDLARLCNTIIAGGRIISELAEAFGLKEKDKDIPEEMAMKAEVSTKKPQDFDTAQAYIKHLQEDISLSEENQERLNNMDEKERSAYCATGTYLYTQGVIESLGLDTKGFSN